VTALHTETRLALDGTAIVVDGYPGHREHPPVFLAHGLGSDAATNWLRAGWVRALRAAGRELILIDLRGHGRSDAPRDPARYRVTTLVGDIRLALRSVNRPVDAIGYSLGARLLLEYAAASDVPIRRLVLGGSAGQPLLQHLDLDGIDDAVGGGPLPADPESARVARVITALPSNDSRALAALVRAFGADPDVARRAPDPAMPTLIAVGDADQHHERARRWAAELPAATFLTLPGRTHVSAVPSGLFRSAAVEFLAR
jgi:pimeloyl-ACP methyl ester carboxylesterase